MLQVSAEIQAAARDFAGGDFEPLLRMVRQWEQDQEGESMAATDIHAAALSLGYRRWLIKKASFGTARYDLAKVLEIASFADATRRVVAGERFDPLTTGRLLVIRWEIYDRLLSETREMYDMHV